MKKQIQLPPQNEKDGWLVLGVVGIAIAVALFVRVLIILHILPT